ncbi:MAG: TRAP transporter TatT component family protein [Gammaproteobacteria bacterium]
MDATFARILLLAISLPFVSACTTIGNTLMSAASERVAASLQSAVVNHNDPATVRDGAPAWLLMVDALAADDPDNAALQAQAAQMYASYAGGFAADDPERARRLSGRARSYGRAGICAQRGSACDLFDRSFDAFEAGLKMFSANDTAVLFAAALGELVWIQAHADDWNAIADLPRVQLLLDRVVALDPVHQRGAPHAYLGVLHSLRPAALGGDPERARLYFERAVELSGGRDLMTKVMYAEYYARVNFNRALHDRLLGEVVEADPTAERYTLGNVLAQARARKLLAEAGDYFIDE